MKKKYFKPEMDVHEMQLQCSLLAGSSDPNQVKEYDYSEDDAYYDDQLG